MTARPDPSIGELMDARERRERMGVLRILFVLLLPVAAFFAALQLPGSDPPSPEGELPPITVSEVYEPMNLEDFQVLGRPLGKGSLHFAVRNNPRSSSSDLVLVDVKEKALVRRYGQDFPVELLWQDSGCLAHEAVPDTFENRILQLHNNLMGSFFSFRSLKYFRWYRVDPLSGESVLRGYAPCLPPDAVESFHGDLVLCFCPSAGLRESPGFMDQNYKLVSLREGRVLSEMPIPGRCVFLNDQAALCFSPYGFARIDLRTLQYRVLHPEGGSFLSRYISPGERVFERAGKRFIGFSCYDAGREHGRMVSIELSDPPRWSEEAISVTDLQEHVRSRFATGGGSALECIMEFNFARGLYLARLDFNSGTPADRTRWFLADVRSGHILLQRDVKRMDFVGEDYVHSRGDYGPEELGPFVDPDPVGAFDEGFMDGDISDGAAAGTANLAASQAPSSPTSSPPIPIATPAPPNDVHHYYRLDDLIPKEDKP